MTAQTFTEYRLEGDRNFNAARVFRHLQTMPNKHTAAAALCEQYPDLSPAIAYALIDGTIPAETDGEDVVYLLPSGSITPIDINKNRH